MKLVLLTLLALTVWLATRPEHVCSRRHVYRDLDSRNGFDSYDAWLAQFYGEPVRR